MIYATVELPGGHLIHLTEGQRWVGDDARWVGVANDYERQKYYPDVAAGVAGEVAAKLGGKVLYVRPFKPRPAGPDEEF
jgi:hypothetical protein